MHFKVSHDAVERGMPQCAESTHCAELLHIARLDTALGARMHRIATAKTRFLPSSSIDFGAHSGTHTLYHRSVHGLHKVLKWLYRNAIKSVLLTYIFCVFRHEYRATLRSPIRGDSRNSMCSPRSACMRVLVVLTV